MNMNDIDTYAKQGNLEMIIRCNNQDTKCSVWAMDFAATYGYLDVVKWLHENRTEGCTQYAMNMACQNGHFEVVKWLHKNQQQHPLFHD